MSTAEEKELSELRPATGRWLVGSFIGWVVLVLCIPPIFVGIPLVFLVWLNNKFTKYRITDQRIILEHGIVFRKVDEIELYRVKDVRVDFSVLNQMANIGTITITSSDTSTQDEPLVMSNLRDAKKHRETLRNLVEAIRQRRGVREFDMLR